MGNEADLAAFLAGATATDNCSDVTIEHDFTALSDDCGATGSATVTFTATDACGNSSSASATFTIEDTTAPSLSIEGPANQDLTQNATCDIDTSVDALGTVTYEAGDDCGSASVEITHADGDALFTCTGDDDLLEGSYTFIRTFTVTATDDCGLTTTQTYDQTITVTDDTAPNFTSTGDVENGEVQSVCWESHLGEVTIPDAVEPFHLRRQLRLRCRLHDDRDVCRCLRSDGRCGPVLPEQHAGRLRGWRDVQRLRPRTARGSSPCRVGPSSTPRPARALWPTTPMARGR